MRAHEVIINLDRILARSGGFLPRREGNFRLVHVQAFGHLVKPTTYISPDEVENPL